MPANYSGVEMNLTDGLTYYKQENYEYYDWAIRLEVRANNILDLLALHDDHPQQSAFDDAKSFLLEVEKWKAGCLKSRIGNAAENSEQAIWYAFLGAHRTPDDMQAILSIMQLKGFGSSTDETTGQKRAKLATSVLRFLWPDRWGVVDWRTVAILGLLQKNDWKVDETLVRARKYQAEDIRGLYDIIDENMACDINGKYREITVRFSESLPRAADVDMALFGFSLMIW